MGGKRFAVLLCAEDSDFVKKKYGGYFGVFVAMLADEGETWDRYHVIHGDFPSDDQIGSYDGFVISGSCNDAHANDAWICELLTFLKKLDSLKKRVLGICFGHQILSRSLGGKTGRSLTGWDIGVRNINLSSSTSISSLLPNNLKLPSKLPVIECHRDEVSELPAKAEIIGWSDKTGIEIFRYEDHLMGIQGHPEYTKDILLSLVDRLIQCNLITECFGEEVKAKMDMNEPNNEAWRTLCTTFLKS